MKGGIKYKRWNLISIFYIFVQMHFDGMEFIHSKICKLKSLENVYI